MEARTSEVLPQAGGPWQYEPKWDGFRCLAFKKGENIRLLAKSGKDLGRYFPEMVAYLKAVRAAEFVIDGELVVMIDGKPEFDALQMRLHPAESRIRKLSLSTPAKFTVFDILADENGASLLDVPLRQRRSLLEQFVQSVQDEDKLVISPATTDRAKAQTWLDASGHGATDGVVAKLLDAPYRPGERTMVKVKRIRTADCVVGGFRYRSGTNLVGSLLLGLYNTNGMLDHVGFTSMISASEAPALTRKLEARKGEGFTGRAPGPSRWATGKSSQWQPLRPELVVEVKFDHVTNERFRHGTRFVRWRPDKSPQQCTFEQIG
ncbi:ATP-dependent DNA ligase [Phyllobacterium zundukense]|jgi:ATP-dependent DNA ligase|uniref:ATP-dependent DNA ligase n=1 Tax=Phyllobacterium zundukense TaxID=1867719 RepID=A0ACD4DA56_9HYPH|nr:ATP-dependent DNA ligase [Phyllobacterium zundukense]UXN62683.1 ATP-dependent DNA ligase [Phyllobacterium zundukense]